VLNSKEIQAAEQAQVYIVETIPPFLFNFYDNLRKEGFTNQQAFTLTQLMLKTFGGNNANTEIPKSN
jgi:hypothetical protein